MDTGSYGPGLDPDFYAERSPAEQRVRRSTCVYKANLWRFPCRSVCFTHVHLFSPSDCSLMEHHYFHFTDEKAGTQVK